MENEKGIKLKNALILEIQQIKEAMIDRVFRDDFHILRVDLSKIIIDSLSEFLKSDYTNAKEIQFQKGQIRLSEPVNNEFAEKMYYFDGTATVNYLNNNFLVNVTYITIYTN
jgi:hypothetical protein